MPIRTDIVYVNLRKNPEWFTGNSKLGRFVPLVETERGQFNGSLIVSDFLDEAYPMPGELYPRNKILKAIDRVFIENFNTVRLQKRRAIFRNQFSHRLFSIYIFSSRHPYFPER